MWLGFGGKGRCVAGGWGEGKGGGGKAGSNWSMEGEGTVSQVLAGGGGGSWDWLAQDGSTAKRRKTSSKLSMVGENTDC